MPHGIDPIVGKTYYTYDGKRFVIKSVGSIDMVVEFSSGMRVVMSHEAWKDLRLDLDKTLGKQ